MTEEITCVTEKIMSRVITAIHKYLVIMPNLVLSIRIGIVCSLKSGITGYYKLS
jgi:hypothetical protein